MAVYCVHGLWRTCPWPFCAEFRIASLPIRLAFAPWDGSGEIAWTVCPMRAHSYRSESIRAYASLSVDEKQGRAVEAPICIACGWVFDRPVAYGTGAGDYITNNSSWDWSSQQSGTIPRTHSYPSLLRLLPLRPSPSSIKPHPLRITNYSVSRGNTTSKTPPCPEFPQRPRLPTNQYHSITSIPHTATFSTPQAEYSSSEVSTSPVHQKHHATDQVMSWKASGRPQRTVGRVSSVGP